MVGRVCFLDKYGLEDAIEFQDIEFEIIDGYYFDEGFNTTIKEKIRYIFNIRKSEKSQLNKAKKALEQTTDPKKKKRLEKNGWARCHATCV